MTKYYDYKPIPKYKKGDMVYRCWAGLWFHHPEPISRVEVKKWQDKWYISYFFFRERTPYDEEDLRQTLKEQLQAEIQSICDIAVSKLESIKKCAENHRIELGENIALLEHLESQKKRNNE